jgi:hypothetical protein
MLFCSPVSSMYMTPRPSIHVPSKRMSPSSSGRSKMRASGANENMCAVSCKETNRWSVQNPSSLERALRQLQKGVPPYGSITFSGRNEDTAHQSSLVRKASDDFCQMDFRRNHPGNKRLRQASIPGMPINHPTRFACSLSKKRKTTMDALCRAAFEKKASTYIMLRISLSFS